MSRPTTVTRRVLLPSLLLSGLVGLLAVLAQLAWIVADERRAAKEQLELVRESTVPSLEEALWGINATQIEAVLQGLVENPAVARVVLTDEEGRRRVLGDARQGVLETGRFPLRYRKAGDLPLGELEVSLGDAVLKGRLMRRGFGTLLVLVLALGVSAVADAWLFRQRVGRPLAAVTRRIERFSVRSPESADDTPLRPHAANDEIDRLETALRVMRAQVSRDVREIERLRDEIAAHAATLEAQVRERTAELEQRNRELEEQRRAIEALANTDVLTGALSRRHFLELAGRERARAAREGSGLAVLLLDIDHFKRVNDTYGHAGGDAVLRAFHATCAAQLRAHDLLGRLGGEEFGVVLSATGREVARQVAERLRAAVADKPVALPKGGGVAVTVSIGLAFTASAAEDIDRLLAAADAALYRAKREGRNRVVEAG
ncbi:MAG: hypothetical protein KatS3mg128_0220 [Silanimonas sp.]|nr:MAG: hypothetical protein KatS3mg128_0220 [Silanimonas sp.]